jgi:hypothetical protein
MTLVQKKWSLQECSRAIASELAMTGQRTINAGSEIAESMKARNQAARELHASLQEAAARLQSETDQRAPLPALLAECSQVWRQEERTLSSSLSDALRQLNEQAHAVSRAVDSMRRCVTSSDAWALRAQAALMEASRTEERLFGTTEECTQLIAEMGAMRTQLEAICAGVGR